MRLASAAKVSTPVWSRSTSRLVRRDAVGPSRGVVRVCRASACDCKFSVFAFEVLCGISCGN